MPPLQHSQHLDHLIQVVGQSRWFMLALRTVGSLKLQSWCIGEGAVRNLVWDHLHGYESPSALADVDVAYFDTSAEPGRDGKLQEILHALQPSTPWEVTNQAFVHTWFEDHFGHPVEPLQSLEDAVATWPEFATSVGISLGSEDQIEIIAPHGLDDLFAISIRRNPRRVSVETFHARIRQKQYSQRWPRVERGVGYVKKSFFPTRTIDTTNSLWRVKAGAHPDRQKRPHGRPRRRDPCRRAPRRSERLRRVRRTHTNS